MVKCLVLILVCISLVYAPAYSQEEGTEYGYGAVLEIKKDSNEIIVSEYAYESGEETEVTYSLHANATVENIDSWKNIPEGTYVDIEYVTGEKGKRIAKLISVYEIEEAEIE